MVSYSRLVEWSPRWPDLIPLDLFLWGCIKEQVYMTSPASLLDLRRRLFYAWSNMTSFMLMNVHDQVLSRLQMCMFGKGELFKHTQHHVATKVSYITPFVLFFMSWNYINIITFQCIVYYVCTATYVRAFDYALCVFLSIDTDAIVFRSNVPNTFWGAAILTAGYLNRLPGRSPDYNNTFHFKYKRPPGLKKHFILSEEQTGRKIKENDISRIFYNGLSFMIRFRNTLLYQEMWCLMKIKTIMAMTRCKLLMFRKIVLMKFRKLRRTVIDSFYEE